MVASKVTISPETRAKLDSPIMTTERRSKLRTQLVKDFIRESKDGVLMKQELVAAAGYDPDTSSQQYHNGIGFIDRLIRKNIISVFGDKKSLRKTYTVVEDVKTTHTKESQPRVTPSPKEIARSVTEGIVQKEPIVELREYKLDNIRLVDMAKQFAWVQNSDSLREFIRYIENAIK